MAPTINYSMKNNKRVISVANNFSRYPAGRFVTDGPCSGEAFHEKWLRPILDQREFAIVQLDGVRGYGSSFLEEAFGGLVRLGYPKDQVKNTFEFQSSDPSLSLEIHQYIDNAT